MTDPNCIFCKIARKEIPAEILYENDGFFAIVDISPNNFGHSLLIPKEHCENIYTCSDETLSRLGKEIQRLSVAVRKAVLADGINVHMNNEPASGQVIFHSHIHIIPRYENDGLQHFAQKKYESADQIKQIGEKIRASL